MTEVETSVVLVYHGKSGRRNLVIEWFLDHGDIINGLMPGSQHNNVEDEAPFTLDTS